jgi:hypothetical protein
MIRFGESLSGGTRLSAVASGAAASVVAVAAVFKKSLLERIIVAPLAVAGRAPHGS